MKKSTAFLMLAALMLTIGLPAIADDADGKALYEKKCAMCHGKDGVAKKMATGSANFNDAAFAASADEIAGVINDGKGKMPGYKEKLSEAEIKAIAEYVKSLSATE